MKIPLVQIHFFRYEGFRNKYWAFSMMQLAYPMLRSIPGLTFYKMLGTGAGNGFSPFPDFSVYGLLTVWENEELAVSFMKDSVLFNRFNQRSSEIWSLFMHPLSSHGSWDGINPFKPDDPELEGEKIAVITRATLDPKKMITFWKNVPQASEILKDQEGLIQSFGIGEWPLSRMATFSLWENEESLKKYAYQSEEHLDVIRKTRSLNWYTEELFSRFRPYKSLGSWEGKDVPV